MERRTSSTKKSIAIQASVLQSLNRYWCSQTWSQR